MRYGFDSPPGWIERPYPPPQKGVLLVAPPLTPRASILFMDAISSVGTLEEQVEAALDQGCADSVVLERGRAMRLPPGPGLPGVVAVAKVALKEVVPTLETHRVFAMFQGQYERLPVVFLGDSEAMTAHHDTLQQVLASIRIEDPQDEALY